MKAVLVRFFWAEVLVGGAGDRQWVRRVLGSGVGLVGFSVLGR